MNKFSDFIIKNKKIILSLFVILTFVAAYFSMKVKTNYDLSKYLPENANSTEAIEILKQEFFGGLSNANIMVKDITIEEAVLIKNQIKEIEGVTSITFIDDFSSLANSLPQEQVALFSESFYKDGNALFTLTLDKEVATKTIEEIKKITDKELYFTGDAIDNSNAEQTTSSEMTSIIMFAVPLLIILLFIFTTAWIEPILFLITIGISILLNNGTNVFLGDISFVTASTSAILQLAISMDYAIFLLHQFNDYKEEGLPTNEALKKAIKDSASSIFSSAVTTILGFIVLVFMSFKIGPDMGIVLGKGIVFSLVTVIFVLPCLISLFDKLIDKTKHKNLIPKFSGVSKGLLHFKNFFAIILLLIAIPAFLASQNNNFQFGLVLPNDDAEIVESVFGKNNQLVIIVPTKDLQTEGALVYELSALENITSINSLSAIVGTEVPLEYIPIEAKAMFMSEKYSRIILNTTLNKEGEEAFEVIKKIKDTTSKYYEENYLAGVTANTYDMKEIITKDNIIVNTLAVIAIGLVLLITFRSLSLPFILLFTIELAIWSNLAITYLLGQELNYIGYLIVNTVQLGATVDYAILLTNKYLAKRKSLTKKEAMLEALKSAIPSLLMPALALTIAGTIIGVFSTNAVVSELGYLLGRGATISFFLVLTLLPFLLMALDKIIEKTTLKTKKETQEK